MGLILAAILRGLIRPFDPSKGDMASLVVTWVGSRALGVSPVSRWLPAAAGPAFVAGQMTPARGDQ